MNRKGTDEPNVTVRLLGTALIVMLALVMSQGTAEGAFSSISKTTNDDFVKENILTNVEEACKTDGVQTFPKDDEYKFTLNGVNKIGVFFHDEIGSDWYTFELKYKGGAKDKFRMDSVGALASWYCTGDPGKGMYEINGTIPATGFSESTGVTGDWVNIQNDTAVEVRIMEEEANKYVNIQVVQD